MRASVAAGDPRAGLQAAIDDRFLAAKLAAASWGTSVAGRTFVLCRDQESLMPFSLSSYLLGIGTVMGALALGFGGGTLLTKAAMKDTTVVPTRVERIARSEPEPAASSQPQPAASSQPQPAASSQKQDVREIPAPSAEPASAARPDPAPAGQAANVAATPQPAPRMDADSTKQPEPVRQAEPASAPEQKDATQTRAAERKIERQKRSAERRARSFAASRMRPPPTEEQDQPERTEFGFRREEPRFVTREEPRSGPFPMFGRPPIDRSFDRAPAARDDD
jgi:hypothetical protein